MSGWIRAASELPPFDQRVLVWHQDRPHVAERWYRYDSENQCDSWCWHIREYYNDILVKWWMPIEEPPSE